MKKISFPAKPSSHLSPEDWIGDKHPTGPGAPMKRLPIDVPQRLHKRSKTQCAMRGENLADTIRKLLEIHFPEDYHQEGAENKTATPTPGNTTL